MQQQQQQVQQQQQQSPSVPILYFTKGADGQMVQVSQDSLAAQGLLNSDGTLTHQARQSGISQQIGHSTTEFIYYHTSNGQTSQLTQAQIDRLVGMAVINPDGTLRPSAIQSGFSAVPQQTPHQVQQQRPTPNQQATPSLTQKPQQVDRDRALQGTHAPGSPDNSKGGSKLTQATATQQQVPTPTFTAPNQAPQQVQQQVPTPNQQAAPSLAQQVPTTPNVKAPDRIYYLTGTDGITRQVPARYISPHVFNPDGSLSTWAIQRGYSTTPPVAVPTPNLQSTPTLAQQMPTPTFTAPNQAPQQVQQQVPTPNPQSTPTLAQQTPTPTFTAPNQAPQQVQQQVPTPNPQSTPGLAQQVPTPTFTAPNQAPQQVPTSIPTATPQQVPQLTQTPNQVPQQVPTSTPTATPQQVPQLTQTPNQVPQQVPTSIPTATPQKVPQITSTQTPTGQAQTISATHSLLPVASTGQGQTGSPALIKEQSGVNRPHPEQHVELYHPLKSKVQRYQEARQVKDPEFHLVVAGFKEP
jgi:hypothetical protein